MYETKISVIIVNYNVKYFLEQCLYSVQAAVAGLDAEVFVVDNNSTDGSVDYLRPRFPEVTFIENKDNPGLSLIHMYLSMSRKYMAVIYAAVYF